MFSRIRQRKSVAGLSVGMIILAMWGNALAGVFCPHMSGGSDCCLLDWTHVHSKTVTQDSSAAPDRMHTAHEQMSDMDMEDGSMDMSVTEPAVTDSQRNSEARVTNTAAAPSSNEQAITQTNDSCSHCLMHSRSSEGSPISIVQDNFSDQIVAAHISAMTLTPAPSPLTIVEIHDHGPPGSVAPLYVLISSFRI